MSLLHSTSKDPSRQLGTEKSWRGPTRLLNLWFILTPLILCTKKLANLLSYSGLPTKRLINTLMHTRCVWAPKFKVKAFSPLFNFWQGDFTPAPPPSWACMLSMQEDFITSENFSGPFLPIICFWLKLPKLNWTGDVPLSFSEVLVLRWHWRPPIFRSTTAPSITLLLQIYR